MTAEIALMNRSAVALAADSAVTVGINNSEKKVFNTATKVFTLSKYAPVGIMIYNGADFCGVPWETIIKDYRNSLGRKRFLTLSDYRLDFVKYIEGNNKFFNDDRKNLHAMRFIYNRLLTIAGDANICSNAKLKSYLQNKIIELENKNDSSIIPIVSVEQTKLIITKYKDIIDAAVGNIFNKSKVSISGCKNLFRKYIVLTLIKDGFSHGYSGVVIAGFGESDVFPVLESFKTDGFILNSMRMEGVEKKEVSDSSPSDIIPFAQTQMMDSVLSGVLPSYNYDLLVEIYGAILEIPSFIIGGISELNDSEKEKYLERHRHSGIGLIKSIEHKVTNLQNDRLLPMKMAISVMPKSELASVAEVFVNVAQLEHRLSLAAETVGGPIDVAVISKGDGFVWIKRKHYFDATLNPGFVENYFHRDYSQE